MSSPRGEARRHRATEADLTTRARIRRAAIARFGRDGFDANLRAIAADAGVTAPAIIKIFGSKDGLHAACDAHVFEIIRENKSAVVGGANPPGALLTQMARAAEYRPMILYVLRSFQAGGDTARAFVDHMTDDALAYMAEGVASGLIVPSRDERGRIRFLVGATLGNLLLEVLYAPDSDAVDSEAFWDAALQRLGLAGLELYTEGLLTDHSMLDKYLQYISDPPMDAAATASTTD